MITTDATNPAVIQDIQLDRLKKKLTGATIEEPTTPLQLIMESITELSAGAVTETILHTRKAFPSMAESVDDIMHHVADIELEGIHATPGNAIMTFYVSYIDLLSYGVKSTSVIGRSSVVIPKDTKVTVDNIDFLTSAPIKISMKDDKVFIENNPTDSNAFRYLGNIENERIVDENDVVWIVFSVPVEQLTRTPFEDVVDTLDSYEANIPFSDTFVRADIRLVDGDGTSTYVNKTLSDIVFHSIPTAKLTILENILRVDIPNFYSIFGDFVGSIFIDVYSSKGNKQVPLYQYGRPKYDIELGVTDTTESAAMHNVTIACQSFGVLDGGSNGKTTKEIISGVVNRVNGRIDMPITSLDIEEMGRRSGYELHKALDITSDRLYVATKEDVSGLFPDSDTLPVISIQKVEVVLGDNVDYPGITKDPISKNLIIRSGTVFKQGHIYTPLTVQEFSLLDEAANQSVKVEFVNENSLVYTPYYYMVDNSFDIVDSRIYDLDSPSLSNLAIVSKNPNITTGVTIIGREIVKVDTGFKLTIELSKIPEDLTASDIGVVVNLQIPGSNITNHIVLTVIDGTTKYFGLLDTNHYVSDKDEISITSTTSVLVSPTTPLDCNLDVYITYSGVPPTIQTEAYKGTDAIQPLGLTGQICLTEESLIMRLGSSLTSIWSSVYTGYTSNKYERYTSDLYTKYQEDVYDLTNGNCGFELVGGVVNKVLLHKAGDVKTLPDFKTGEIVMENGLPKIDVSGGIFRHIDIMMLEYNMQMRKDVTTTADVVRTKALLKTWAVNGLLPITSGLLENTRVVYKPNHDGDTIYMKLNNNDVKYNAVLTPVVTISTNDSNFLNNFVLKELIKSIGKIIHAHINKPIVNKIDLKNEIIETLDNSVVGITIQGLGPDNMDILPKINGGRFRLGKITNKDFSVTYNLTIKTIKVI